MEKNIFGQRTDMEKNIFGQRDPGTVKVTMKVIGRTVRGKERVPVLCLLCSEHRKSKANWIALLCSGDSQIMKKANCIYILF